MATLDSRLPVGHVDVALVGSSDLSQELGIAGDYEPEKMVECYQHVLDVCTRRQVTPGLAGVSDVCLVQHWRDHGLRFLYCANETHLLVQGGRRIVETIRPV